jgi:zinc protease
MTELGQALAGRGVDAFAQQGGTAFTLGRTTGPVTPDALELQMQLFAARLAHPGWRTEFWPGLIASLANSDDADLSSPMNVWGREGPALLHPDDARWVANTGALRASWTPDQAVAFMKPIVETAPIEIVMVGDITADRAIEVTAKTFGALPSRTETKEPAGLREAHFPKPVVAPVVLHHNGPDSQALAVIAWPTTDGFADRMDTHAAAVLSSVIQERAIARLRNAEGKTYTPIVGTDFSQVFAGYGVLMAMAQVEAVDVDEVFVTFDDIAADILAHGISDDEFQRALKPRIEGSERNQTNNLFWLRALVGAQADPRKLDFAATQAEEFHKVTLADVIKSAKKWLDRKRSWRAEVIPRAKAAAASGQ